MGTKEPRPKSQERFKDLDEPFVWENKSDVANIPDTVRPVVDDLIVAIGDVYGKDLNGALYLDGSVVSGGFRLGESDIDAVWISTNPVADDHREARIERLGQIDLRGVVGYLDVVAMEEADLGDPSRRSSVFVCANNGMQVAGNSHIELEGHTPKTKGDYVLCQYGRFGVIIEKSREEYDLDSLLRFCPRSLAKRVARASFVDAYLRGCPYEQSTSAMPKALQENGFIDELQLFERMRQLSAKTLSDEEKEEVFREAERLLSYFKPIIEEYNSPYSVWVRIWLDEQS